MKHEEMRTQYERAVSMTKEDSYILSTHSKKSLTTGRKFVAVATTGRHVPNAFCAISGKIPNAKANGNIP